MATVNIFDHVDFEVSDIQEELEDATDSGSSHISLLVSEQLDVSASDIDVDVDELFEIYDELSQHDKRQFKKKLAGDFSELDFVPKDIDEQSKLEIFIEFQAKFTPDEFRALMAGG